MIPSTTSGKPTNQTFTVGLVVHFVAAVREVFSTMLGTAVNVASPHNKSHPSPTFDVSAIVGISGQVVGSMVLSFEMETAAKIVAALSGAVVSPKSPDFPDAVGEIANMIAGSAKRNFGATASISIPSIVMGGGHTLARLHDQPCIVIPCNTDLGRFVIEVSVKPNP